MSTKRTTIQAPEKLLQSADVTTGVSIIEDDDRLRGIFAGLAREADGLRFVSDFGDADTALAKLPGQSPVVLVDINLPGMDGVECVRQLKLAMPKTQFMMVTVYEGMLSASSVRWRRERPAICSAAGQAEELLGSNHRSAQRRFADDQQHCP